MTQVGEFLKPLPPRREPDGNRPAPPDKDRERNSLNFPVAPVAGFRRRVGALLFDFLTLYALFFAVGFVAGGPLLQLGHWSSTLAAIVVLLYFALATGPVGKGRTIGKFLVGIRVVGYDGQTPSLGRALVRTALLYPGILVAFFVGPFVFDADTYRGLVFQSMAAGYLTFAHFVGTAIAIMFNPFKQGMHDFLSRTLVQPAALPTTSFEETCEIIGGQWQRFHRQAMINGTATFLLILTLLVIMTVRGLGEDKAARLHETERGLARQHLSPTTFISMRLFPVEADPQRLRETVTPELVQSFVEDLYDADSSATLRVAMAVQSRGRWRPGDGDAAAVEARLTEFARDYQQEVFGALDSDQIYPLHRERQTPVQNLRYRPLRFDIVASESVFLFFPRPMHTRRVTAFEVDLPPLEPWPDRDSGP